MNMMFKAFCKKLFGAGYERLKRTIFIDLIVFWGLYTADFSVQIAPCILYLMVAAFTAEVMWQALSSKDTACEMQNMLMIPFERREFVFSYAAALGIYTIFTKTAALLAVLLAVSDWKWGEILISILCMMNAVLMAAAVYSIKRHWFAKSFWTAAAAAAGIVLWDTLWFIPALIGNGISAMILLGRADGYSFYHQEYEKSRAVKKHRHCSVWIYLFRYLSTHKNYLTNTFIMWCAACALPLFFQQMDSRFVIPIGFAVLSLNTPICILLSCDPDLDQAVRMLPDQKLAFCMPYCVFIFVCNIIADSIFLCSWQFQMGGVTMRMIVAAMVFALTSAVCSILLEWYYPIRGWKIESDLWHHPRKYIVPAAMLLFAGAVGTVGVLF